MWKRSMSLQLVKTQFLKLNISYAFQWICIIWVSLFELDSWNEWIYQQHSILVPPSPHMIKCNSYAVELPVKFVKKLRDKIAIYKHRGHLECQVSRASAQVKWFKNKTELKPGQKYEIKSEDVYRKLTIHNVDADDEDTYTCDASDDKTSCKLLVEGKTIGGQRSCTGNKSPESSPIRPDAQTFVYHLVSNWIDKTDWRVMVVTHCVFPPLFDSFWRHLTAVIGVQDSSWWWMFDVPTVIISNGLEMLFVIVVFQKLLQSIRLVAFRFELELWRL